MLITPKEIIDIAIGGANFNISSINESEIKAAEIKWIKSELGDDLYNALNDGKYPDFVNDYIKPCLAYYVKSKLIPVLSLALNNGGIGLINTQYSSSGTDAQRAMLINETLDTAGQYLNAAKAYLQNHTSMFPEYKPSKKAKTSFGVIL